MTEVTTIGLDIAKQVFQVHGADASGHVKFRKRLTRTKLIEFFRSQPQCLVALEACGGAHHWGREIARLGHIVRLIPPAYVKPFVKRQKNVSAIFAAPCGERRQLDRGAWGSAVEHQPVFWCKACSPKLNGIRSAMSVSGGRRGNSVST